MQRTASSSTVSGITSLKGIVQKWNNALKNQERGRGRKEGAGKEDEPVQKTTTAYSSRQLRHEQKLG